MKEHRCLLVNTAMSLFLLCLGYLQFLKEGAGASRRGAAKRETRRRDMKLCLLRTVFAYKKKIRFARFGQHYSTDDRAFVSHTSYLDVDSHWKAMLLSLRRHSVPRPSSSLNLADYCVVALNGNSRTHGVVLGDLHVTERLIIVNWGDVHFDPCLLA